MNSLSLLFESQNLISDLFNKKIIIFRGSFYPILFFSFFLKKLKQEYDNTYYINVLDLDLNSIKSKLEFTFLGNNSIYFLGNITDVEAKKKEKILYYIKNYKGSNIIILFCDLEEKDYIDCNNINLEIFNKLSQFYKVKNIEVVNYYFQNILKRGYSPNLDQCCLLIQYSQLLGVKANEFLSAWVDKIFTSEQSLFILSKYFFAKDSNNFFIYWDKIKDNYNFAFWTIYWSEQIFKASNFIKLNNERKNIQAKQMAYLLPFTFIQGGWKKINSEELKLAHKFIYEIDYSLKNGCTDVNLDLFYAKFFANEFKN